MRGIVRYHEDGSWEAEYYSHGIATPRSSKNDSNLYGRFGLGLPKRPAGFYLLTVTVEDDILTARVGSKLDREKAEKKYRKMSETRGSARTGSPGIRGFQHMENMANARQAYIQRENRQLANFLELGGSWD